MDNILKTMYLRLDSTTKSLTKNAISQLLIKILYASSKSLTENQLISEYKRILNKKKIDENQIKKNIQLLCDDNSIRRQRGSFYLSQNKRDKIDQSYKESEARKQRIIELYFKPLYSDRNIIADWLSDATMLFFKMYSNEWIADLCYKHKSAIANSKENILNTIKERTLKNKDLDKRDREELSKMFINFLTTKDDNNIAPYLWEYGISSFSAQLISNFNGSDEFSIDTFRDCKCVLDTNVLMHIGLELSEYYSAFKSLEEIFLALNIEIGILYITKDEYTRTIGNIRDEIVKLVEKYPLSVIEKSEESKKNQYLKTAIARKCKNADDFLRFFSPLMNPPEFVEEKVKINQIDDDKKLQDVIDRTQKDERKLNELNTLFKKITGKDKRRPALIHDVGLIAGVDYLRKQDKFFILSQEVSVNTYAKEKPSQNDLPISIRLETLINILAVDSGGIDIDATDYVNLFAAIIRNGLIPNKNIFKLEDLSIMLEKDEQITQLPPEETIRIAKKIHRERLLGADDKKIELELRREIQGVKLKIVDDLTETKSELSMEKSEKNRYKNQADVSTKALQEIIRNEYKKKIRNSKILFFCGIPLIFIFLGIVGFIIYRNLVQSTNFIDYSISIFIEIIINVLFIIFASKPKIIGLKKQEEEFVNNELQRRLQREK
jgi:hypothetical protein